MSLHGADAARARGLVLDGVRVLDAAPHPTRLRTGHLRGNRFRLVVRGTPAGRIDDARRCLDRLQDVGMPAYFGEQRFGLSGDNAARALEWVSGRARPPRSPFHRKLGASALQAALFNHIVADRVRRGALAEVCDGALLRKEDTGGLFASCAPEVDQARADAWEVSPTGPMFGPKMRWPERAAGAAERALLERAGLDEAALARLGRAAPGTRRPVRVRPTEVAIEPVEREDALRVSFTLPSGSYATVLMRELLMDDPPATSEG